MRQPFSVATACSLSARSLATSVLNYSLSQSRMSHLGARLIGTIVMPSTPTYPRSPMAGMSARSCLRPEAAKAWASWRAPWTAIGPMAAICPPVRRDLNVHARVAGFAREQVGYVLPVPGRGDRAVHQRGVAAEHLTRMRDKARDRPPDDRPQQVPAAADRGLARPEDRARHLLGDVAAHQADHQHDRLVGTDRGGTATRLGTSASSSEQRENSRSRCPDDRPVRTSRSNGPSPFRLRFATQMKECGPLFCLPLSSNPHESVDAVD